MWWVEVDLEVSLILLMGQYYLWRSMLHVAACTWRLRGNHSNVCL